MRKLSIILVLVITFVSCEKNNNSIDYTPPAATIANNSNDATGALLGGNIIDLPQKFMGVYKNGVGQYTVTALRGVYPQNNQAPQGIVRIPNGTDYDEIATTYEFLAFDRTTEDDNGTIVYTNSFRQLINEAYGFEIAGRVSAYQLTFADVPSGYKTVGIFNVGSVSAEWIIIQSEGAIFTGL